MSSAVSVFVLSACMFCASMLFGLSPTVITMSERHGRRLGSLGAGLLVGTALGVILPEGISEIYSVHHVHHQQSQVDVHTRQATTSPKREKEKRHLQEALDLHHALANDDVLDACQHYVHASMEGKNKLIGFALVSGFVLMLLIDFVTGAHNGHNHQIVACEPEMPSRLHRSWMATVGLVVHSATDGIAMGAASFADASVTAIVFMAVLIHKGPAAFGLSVYLLHNGLDVKKVRKHLLVFSLSAPITSIVTFFLVNQMANGGTGSDGGGTPTNTIGILLLLSAGSFIFVATVHILPSVPLHIDSGATSCFKKYLPLELLFLLVGSALPLLLHMEHGH